MHVQPTVLDPHERLPYHRIARVVPQTSQWWRPLATLGMTLALALAAIVAVLIVMGVVALAAPSLRPSSENLEDGSNPIDLMLSLGPLALLIPIAILATRVGGARRGMHSVFGRFRWAFMLKAAPIVIAVYVLTGPVLAVTFSRDEFHVKHSVARVVLALLIVLLVTPFQSAGEEYVFRGLPQQGLGTWLKSPWWGIILPIPLFCVGHGYDWVGQIDIAVFAFCAGVLTWKSGGLELPILLHATNNVSIMILGPFLAAPDSMAQGDVSPVSLIFSLPVTLGVTAYLWWYTNRQYGVTWRQPVTVTRNECDPNIVPPPVMVSAVSPSFAPAMFPGPGAAYVHPQPAGAYNAAQVMVSKSHPGGFVNYQGLRNVADRAALYAALRQSILAEHIDAVTGPDNTFDADLASGRLSFVGSSGRLDAHAELVASVAPGPRSLMWGWAHPQGRNESSDAIRRLGERFRIPDLTQPEIPFAQQPTEADEGRLLAHLAGAAATEAIRDEGFYYIAPTPAGQYVVFWIKGFEGDLQPTMAQVVARVPALAQQSYSTDLRSGLLGLAEHLGWYLEWRDQTGSAGRLSDPYGNAAEFFFLPDGRLTSVQGHLVSND